MRKWHDFVNPLHQGLVTLSRWNVSHGVWPSSVILLDLPSFFSSSSSEAKSHELRKRTIWPSEPNDCSFTHWLFDTLRSHTPSQKHRISFLSLVCPQTLSRRVFFFFHLKNEFNSIFDLIGVRALSSTLKRQTDKTMPVTIPFSCHTVLVGAQLHRQLNIWNNSSQLFPWMLWESKEPILQFHMLYSLSWHHTVWLEL